MAISTDIDGVVDDSFSGGQVTEFFGELSKVLNYAVSEAIHTGVRQWLEDQWPKLMAGIADNIGYELELDQYAESDLSAVLADNVDLVVSVIEQSVAAAIQSERPEYAVQDILDQLAVSVANSLKGE